MEPDTNGVPVPPELQSLLDRGVITWRQLGQLMGHPDMPRPTGPDAVAASRTVWLRPEWAWREARLQEIQDAVKRYKATGMTQAPVEWTVELAEHLRWIKARRHKLTPELAAQERQAGLESMPEAVDQLERAAAAHEQGTGPAVEPVDEVTAGIIKEIYITLTGLGADSQLLGTMGSWGETLTAEQVLSGLRAWNNAHPVIITSYFWSAAKEAADKGGQHSLKDCGPERQRALLTDKEWAMVERAGGLTSEGKGGEPS